MPSESRPIQRYLAIALVSCAILLYQIAITRVLSVILWYHFAFLAISLALLGLGLPGVWFSLKKPGPRALPVSLVLGALAAPATLALLFHFGGIAEFQRGTPDAHLLLNRRLLLAVVCVLAPLLALGAAVCLLLMAAPGRTVGRMYGADLIGATAGALLVVPLMHVVPTPLLIAGTGLLPLAAAILLEPRLRWVATSLAVALVALLAWGKPFELKFSKSYVESDRILYERWTPTARITIFPDVFYVRDPEAAFGWGMGKRYEPRPLRQMWIEQDGSAGTPITQLTGEPRELGHLLYDVTSVGYQLRPARRACVIGSGGGRDVLTALATGARDVDAVELNGAIVEALSGPLRDFSGDLYNLPGVTTHVSEGRSFLTRSRGDYDLIQISLIDSWAATAAGAYSLSENYLYTVEALRLYLRRLGPEGLISMSRWVLGEREYEGVRLMHLIEEALRLEGVEEPERHLAVAQAWSVGTFLVSGRPFREEELRRLEEIAETRGFEVRWPRDPGASGSSTLAAVLSRERGAQLPQGLDLKAPTDDRPFFFQTVSVLGGITSEQVARLSNNEQSVVLLRFVLVLVGGLTLVLFFVPFLFRRSVRGPGFWRGSGYFTCIGLGFMLVEIPWIQRFVLYLGHPSYATTVVLSALLLGAGCGALLSSRYEVERVARVGFLLPASVVAVNLLLGPLFEATLGAGFGLRALVSALVLFPTGVLMGFAFPAGLVAFGDQHKPWFWAVNGASSVVASVVSLVLAMAFGFFATVLLGAAVYALAWVLLPGDDVPDTLPNPGSITTQPSA